MNTLEMLKDLGRVDPPDRLVLDKTADALASAVGEAKAEAQAARGVHALQGPVPLPQDAEPPSALGVRARRRTTARQRRTAVAALAAVAVASALVAGALVVTGHDSPVRGPIATPWQAGRPLHNGGQVKAGRWQLVDDVLSGTWQQYMYGPPPGPGSCPTATACYVMAGHYASASAAEPTSESLDSSTNDGATWTVLPMPPGFVATTNLSCAGATSCAAGGIDQGQPVLAVTTDGGHSFVTTPLPAGGGTLYDVSCPTATSCGGLAATSTWKGVPHDIPIHATFLYTGDGGKTFADAPFPAGDSMQTLACSSATDCTAVGSELTNASGTPGPSVVAVTTDGGRTWASGAFPSGFALLGTRTLTCPDASHCSVAGRIPKGTGKTSTPTPTAPAVATTVNGGLTWVGRTLPASVPRLLVTSLSCPTDNECWMAGMYRPVHETPVLLGTTDGGATWSVVAFSAPAGAPNFDNQSYITMGQIDCATANVCVARGGVAQGSSSAPFYSLVVPNG